MRKKLVSNNSLQIALLIWLSVTTTVFGREETVPYLEPPDFASNIYPKELEPTEIYSMYESTYKLGRPLSQKLYRLGDRKKAVAGMEINEKGQAKLLTLLPLYAKDLRVNGIEADIHFGESRKYGNRYVYDLIADNYDEPNIYHLELLFDKDGRAHQYRIRGLGISDFDFSEIRN